MKRYLLAALAVIILLYPATASAAPIKHCARPAMSSVYHLTARKFTCNEARAIARNYVATGKAHMLYETTNYNSLSGGYADVRLHDRYGWVVRFWLAQD